MARTNTGKTATSRRAGGRRAPQPWWKRRVIWGKAVWRRLSARPGIAHLMRGIERFNDRMGNQFAAAITYFSFLSLVPMLMVSFSAAGFVLASQPDLLDALKGQVVSLLGNSFDGIINKAVEQRYAVGIVGLLVAMYSGLSWIGNVRDAVQAQWRPQWVRAKVARQNFLADKLSDLISLGGLLVAVLVSFSLTAVGTAAQDVVTGWFGLQDITWVSRVLTVGPFAVAIIADTLIFAWVYTIFPFKGYRADRRTLVIGSVVMSVVFEVLKAALTLLISRMSHSPTGAVFGAIIGLLLFFNLVARAFLMIAAWMSTAAEESAEVPRVATTHDDPSEGDSSGSAGNVGAGSAAGRSTGRHARPTDA